MTVFTALNRWASGQQENFLTESFAETLKVLFERDFDAFAEVLRPVAGCLLEWPEDGSFSVSTQVATDEGYPDLEIRGPNTRLLVEVKDMSPVDRSQLERYLSVLETGKEPSKALIVLTRHSAVPAGFDGRVRAVNWTSIGEACARVKLRTDLDPVALFIIDQFVDLLEAKGMAISKVNWSLTDGMQQFMNLKALLTDALEQAGAHRVWAAYGANFNGVAVPDPSSNNSTYSWFIQFENPTRLLFTTFDEYVKPEFASEWERHSNNSVRKVLDLESEQVHFYARSVSSQSAFLFEMAKTYLSETVYDPELSA